MAVLRVGQWAAEIDDNLLQLAGSCCYLDRFRIGEGAPGARLRVRRVESLPASVATALDGLSADAGSYAVEGNTILVRIPPSPASAEASLRAVFQVATLRQGGLLVHGSGVAFDGKSVIAIGESGAGKSTLARLCLAAGGRLLSDETIGLYPDGAARGSPFFSDPDMASQLDRSPLAAILVLEKGGSEQIAPIEARKATAEILSQAYRPPAGEASQAELLARATALALNPGIHRLTFRNDPAAGAFVKRWILESSG
jgi:hypothetical protein